MTGRGRRCVCRQRRRGAPLTCGRVRARRDGVSAHGAGTGRCVLVAGSPRISVCITDCCIGRWRTAGYLGMACGEPNRCIYREYKPFTRLISGFKSVRFIPIASAIGRCASPADSTQTWQSMRRSLVRVVFFFGPTNFITAYRAWCTEHNERSWKWLG
ncbi:hypothetical protein DFH06DRAFT_1234062 [Mycena polygramma]|nr:hypothetical protein DFH06DRAFT_1234062 [Mycena polygramma]